ncbi:MAG: biotin/lipoyl-binding protein [Thermoplasmata archaeon]|nr:biotin/lipoyl-binding protein [Thermoplasmata archaeon]
MRLDVAIDGETTTVEVDLDRGTVRWNGREVPLKVLKDALGKVELEVAGERLVVEGWPEATPDAPPVVVVSGEQYRTIVKRVGAGNAPRPVPSTGTPTAIVSGPVAPSIPGGTPVAPPMPGKVVELRVREGDRVGKGQVLLVLEAMKMRNEIAAPVAGRVADLKVSPGSNVRAREPMLTLVP